MYDKKLLYYFMCINFFTYTGYATYTPPKFIPRLGGKHAKNLPYALPRASTACSPLATHAPRLKKKRNVGYKEPAFLTRPLAPETSVSCMVIRLRKQLQRVKADLALLKKYLRIVSKQRAATSCLLPHSYSIQPLPFVPNTKSFISPSHREDSPLARVYSKKLPGVAPFSTAATFAAPAPAIYNSLAPFKNFSSPATSAIKKVDLSIPSPDSAESAGRIVETILYPLDTIVSESLSNVSPLSSGNPLIPTSSDREFPIESMEVRTISRLHGFLEDGLEGAPANSVESGENVPIQDALNGSPEDDLSRLHGFFEDGLEDYASAAHTVSLRATIPSTSSEDEAREEASSNPNYPFAPLSHSLPATSALSTLPLFSTNGTYALETSCMAYSGQNSPLSPSPLPAAIQTRFRSKNLVRLFKILQNFAENASITSRSMPTSSFYSGRFENEGQPSSYDAVRNRTLTASFPMLHHEHRLNNFVVSSHTPSVPLLEVLIPKATIQLLLQVFTGKSGYPPLTQEQPNTSIPFDLDKTLHFTVKSSNQVTRFQLTLRAFLYYLSTGYVPTSGTTNLFQVGKGKQQHRSQSCLPLERVFFEIPCIREDDASILALLPQRDFKDRNLFFPYLEMTLSMPPLRMLTASPKQDLSLQGDSLERIETDAHNQGRRNPVGEAGYQHKASIVVDVETGQATPCTQTKEAGRTKTSRTRTPVRHSILPNSLYDTLQQNPLGELRWKKPQKTTGNKENKASKGMLWFLGILGCGAPR